MYPETHEGDQSQSTSSIGHLSLARLKRVLDYNPKTGKFTWLISPAKNIRAGDEAGSDTGWYIRINIDGRAYLAHRLAWFYTYEYWPKEIDHINGIIADNRLVNLREVSRRQNCLNREHPSEIKGVRFRNGAYEANIKIDGKSIYLGRFKTKEAAADAFIAAEKKRAKEWQTNH